MQIINNKDLVNISGGLNLSGTLLNSFTNIIKTLLDLGRSVGSSIRRIAGDELCPINK